MSVIIAQTVLIGALTMASFLACNTLMTFHLNGQKKENSESPYHSANGPELAEVPGNEFLQLDRGVIFFIYAALLRYNRF